MAKRGRPRKPRPEEEVRQEIEQLYAMKIAQMTRQMDYYAEECERLQQKLDELNKRCDELLNEIQTHEQKEEMLRELIIDAIRGVYS